MTALCQTYFPVHLKRAKDELEDQSTVGPAAIETVIHGHEGEEGEVEGKVNKP